MCLVNGKAVNLAPVFSKLPNKIQPKLQIFYKKKSDDGFFQAHTQYVDPPMASFGIMNQDTAQTVEPIFTLLICRKNRFGQGGATLGGLKISKKFVDPINFEKTPSPFFLHARSLYKEHSL